MTETQRNILHLIAGFLLFPTMVLGVIPGLLAYYYGYTLPHPTDVGYWIAKLLLPGGVVVMGWTIALFFFHGKGTPVPWAPPKRLVVSGVYAHVRNPMMLGVLMFLAGEALLVSSLAIAAWFAIAAVALHTLVVFYEEPGLHRRFGDDYRLYQANVRRWLPRLSGWTPPWQAVEDEPEHDPQAHHWEGYDKGQNEDGEKDGNQGGNKT